MTNKTPATRPANDPRNHNLATGEQMRAAWALRKELAAKHGVKVLFIKLGDCIREIVGRSIGVIRDAFGNQLGFERSRINYHLLTESAVCIDRNEIIETIGCSSRKVGTQFTALIRRGFMADVAGWVSLVLKKRPFAQA
jgi:hypothetical protein